MLPEQRTIKIRKILLLSAFLFVVIPLSADDNSITSLSIDTFQQQLRFWIAATAISIMVLFMILLILVVTLRKLNLNRDVSQKNETTVIQLLETINIPLCIVDFNGEIVIGNNSFSQILIGNSGELDESNIYNILPKTKDNTYADIIHSAWAVRRNGLPISLGMKEYRRDDGFSAWLEISLSRIIWQGRPSLLIRILDLSKQKETEDKLRQVEKMQAIGQLAGGIAHDFNNQLMAINGYANLLSEQLDNEALEYVTHIKRAAESSQELTRQLLAFSRKGTFKESVIPIKKEIEHIIALLSRSIDRRIILRKELPEDSLYTRGDSSLLQNALLNLGLNARDAMPTGGTITFRAEKKQVRDNEIHWINGLLPAGEYIVISISDTGSGIPNHTLPRIFDPFFTTKPSGSGTGMGLPAVLGTVTRHNGAVTLTTIQNKGTTFNLYLPLYRINPAEIPATAASIAQETGNAPDSIDSKRGNIIVCDDEQVIRFLISNILTKAGYSVTTCADGLEGLKLFQDNPDNYDLVILDMIMPIMNGEEVFLKMRSIKADIPVIIISGFSEIEHSAALIKKGLNAYLAKPISPEDLLNSVNNIREGRSLDTILD